jgi:hypothetical protein
MSRFFLEVHCAWCAKEGVASFLRTKPTDDPAQAGKSSHTVCPRHRTQLRRELAAYERRKSS